MKDTERMERIKFYQRTCLHSGRITKWTFSARRSTFSLSFTSPKCQRIAGARWNCIYREFCPVSRDITDLRVTKIEGSCLSWFFTIFQELPTESWMRLRVFRDGPGCVNACAWHSRFNVNPLCRWQGEKEQTDKSDPSIRVTSWLLVRRFSGRIRN